jgi:membrane protein implicated in regulation of membrane protease activity
MVGVAVLGLAVALGVFIQFQSRDPRPPEDVPRALAIPALYATMGFLAIIGALRRRPAIVVAAGVLCIAGMILSVATIGFAAPGLLLILLGSRIEALPTRHGSEAVSAAAAVLLVVSAAIALLVMTEGRCWQATGSPADPTYTVIPCGGQGVLVAGGQTFASGFDSGVLTTGGGLVEAVLLLGALTLAAVTGRTPTSTGVQPSIDQAPPP